MTDKRIHLGTAIAAHGLKGEVKVKSFCGVPEDICAYGSLQDEAGNMLDGKALSALKDVVVVRFKQIKTREDAEAFAKAKAKLYVTRGQLPDDGGIYFEDFKSLRAVDASGADVGVVKEMINYGAGDVLVIDAQAGEFMLPYKQPFAEKPDLKARTVQVMVPEGWLPSTKEPKPKKEKR